MADSEELNPHTGGETSALVSTDAPSEQDYSATDFPLDVTSQARDHIERFREWQTLPWLLCLPDGTRYAVDTLVDEGSSHYSFLNEELAVLHGLKPKPLLKRAFWVRGFGGEGENITHYVLISVACPHLSVQNTGDVLLLLVKDPSVSLLLGLPFILRFDIRSKIDRVVENQTPLPIVVHRNRYSGRIYPISDGRNKGDKLRDQMVQQRQGPECDETLKIIMAKKLKVQASSTAMPFVESGLRADSWDTVTSTNLGSASSVAESLASNATTFTCAPSEKR